MNQHDILIVHSDDWQALYIDGDKRYEGHSVSIDTVLENLGIDIRHFFHPDPDDPDKCDPHTLFPQKWKSPKKKSP